MTKLNGFQAIEALLSGTYVYLAIADEVGYQYKLKGYQLFIRVWNVKANRAETTWEVTEAPFNTGAIYQVLNVNN